MIEAGYVANIPYFLCYAFKELKQQCMLLMPSSLETRWWPIFYGYSPNGNPFNIDIRFYKGSPWLSLSRILHDLPAPSLIHTHIGSALRDIYPIQFISSLFRVPTLIEFHGTDARELRKAKKTLLSFTKTSNPYVYFVGSTPDLLNCDIDIFWLPNPVDPIALNFKCEPNLGEKAVIFIPTRFDENKNVHYFLYRFYQAIKTGHISPKHYVLKIIRWGQHNLLTLVDTLIEKLRTVGIDVIVMPLMERLKYFYELCHSNVVIGQFRLGVYGQIELEALAMNKHIISNIDDDLYIRSIGELPPIHNYNPLGDAQGKGLSVILNNLDLNSENLYGRRYVLKYHKAENIALTIFKVLGLR